MDFLGKGEEIVFELKEGWKDQFGGTLVLTNKRLVFLKEGKVDEELQLNQVNEAYIDEPFVGLAVIRIPLTNGEEHEIKLVEKSFLSWVLFIIDVIFIASMVALGTIFLVWVWLLIAQALFVLIGIWSKLSYLSKQRSLSYRWVTVINRII